MNRCATEQALATDQRLRDRIDALLQDFSNDPEAARHLQSSNEAWDTFVTAECERLAHAYEGGSIQPLIRADCYQSLATHRLALLSQPRSEGALPRTNAWQDMLDRGTFWGIARPLSVDVNCDGVLDTVVGGIRPADMAENPLTYVLSISDGPFADDAPGSWTTEFPVDHTLQGGLCAPGVNLSIQQVDPSGCPVVRLDDGQCDAIHVWVDSASGDLRWDRN